MYRSVFYPHFINGILKRIDKKIFSAKISPTCKNSKNSLNTHDIMDCSYNVNSLEYISCYFSPLY